jgi:hypothetical protein
MRTKFVPFAVPWPRSSSTGATASGRIRDSGPFQIRVSELRVWGGTAIWRTSLTGETCAFTSREVSELHTASDQLALQKTRCQ